MEYSNSDMPPFFKATKLSLEDLLTVAQAALRNARQPHEGTVGPAETKLSTVQNHADRARQDYQTARAELSSIEATRLRVKPGKTADTLDTAVRSAAETMLQATAALESADEACRTAAAELQVARAPIQAWLDVCAGIDSIAKGFETYEQAERSRREAEARAARVCQSCGDRPGGCRDCDITR